MTLEQAMREVRGLRRQARELMDDLLLMSGVLCGFAEDLNRLESRSIKTARDEAEIAWLRERIPALRADIERFEAQRARLLARVREIERGGKWIAA